MIEQYWKDQAFQFLSEGEGFVKILERSLSRTSRFNNDLLFNLSVMSFEKLFVALLSYYGIEATHHAPLALYREAQAVDSSLTDNMKQTARLIASHESICSLDDKGYSTPTDDELGKIIIGLIEIRDYVSKKVKV
ncbi:MAG: hypothetical protein ACK5JU_07530 [Bacteroidales bacterium]